MFKLLIIALTVLSGYYITEIQSKACTNYPFNHVPYCEKLTQSMKGYECVENICRKMELSCKDRQVCLTSLDVCKLSCGQTPIWPMPTGNLYVSKELSLFRPSRKNTNLNLIAPKGSQNCKRFITLIDGLLDKVKNHTSSYPLPKTDNRKLLITVIVNDTSVQLTKETAENYTLYISSHTENIVVRIIGKTFFAVRHGIETLQQLIVYDEKTESLVIPIEVTIIDDKPAYSYRGLMLDTARNYIPVKNIKRTLDAMAMNKMNNFHWHMTDSNSFPYVSKKYPQMSAIGAYSKNEVYTRDDTKEVVEHARSCGIRVIPELDAPAHVGEAWDKFVDRRHRRKYLTCFNQTWTDFCSAPPCGQLDPTIDEVYDVLGELYSEYATLFDSDLFHMGSNEVNPKCWELPHIEEWKSNKKVVDFVDLWAHFQKKSLEKLIESNNRISQAIIWSSNLTANENVTQYVPPSNYIVQLNNITEKMVKTLTKAKYNLIVSAYNPFYLDCGFGNWTTNTTGWCDPYKTWDALYMADPVKIVSAASDTKNLAQLVLGAEAILWSNMADEHTLDSLLWPRAAALAERLWSNPSTEWNDAVSRMSYHRNRMAAKGIAAEILQPLWCMQNGEDCTN